MFEESCGALLDMGGYGDIMNFAHVLCHIFVAIKTFRTVGFGAFESLFIKVSRLVLNPVAFGGESSAAEVTLKWFFTSVYSLMQ